MIFRQSYYIIFEARWQGAYFLRLKCGLSTSYPHSIHNRQPKSTGANERKMINMATAKKLPSGSWRCLVYSHSEPVYLKDGKPALDKNGKQKQKRIYESFTCDDPSKAGKRQAEKEAAAFAADKSTISRPKDLTLGEAIDKYCELKSNVLSPSTIREYRRMRKNYYRDLADMKLRKLSSELVQHWVNKFAAKHSPKTTRNAYGLLSAVMEMYAPGIQLDITLPQKVKPDLYVPTDSDIRAILDHFSANDKDMEIAVYMAAFGTMRRSEICALTTADVSGNTVRINKAMVDAGKTEWVMKTTKTVSSARTVEMPEYIIKKLPDKGKLVNLNPDQVTRRFERALTKLNVPHFRFHDLRHYAASVMHAIGVPDQYIMARGGWSSDGTLKRIYRGTMEDYNTIFTGKIIDHFETMQHEMQHNKKKAL